MILYKVIRNGVVTNQWTSDFADETHYEDSFGRKKQWMADKPSEPLDPALKAIALQSREVASELGNYFEYEIPAEYEVVPEDISTQVQDQKDIEKNIKRINFGVHVMAELAARNKKRLVAGTTNVSDIFAAEAKLVTVQRYLQNSSTEKAYQDLLVLDIPELPASEKQYFLDKIQAYLAAE